MSAVATGPLTCALVLVAACGNNADFGLPRGLVKALSEVCAAEIDPSECSRQLGMGIDATGPRSVEKRCALEMEVLKSAIDELPYAERAQRMATTCKIDLPVGVEARRLNAWALLTSAVVADELSADGVTTEDEKKVSQALAQLCLLGR